MTRTTAPGWAAVLALALLASLLGALPAASADDPSISFSLEQKRTSPQALAGATVDGTIHPFLTADAGVTAVSWWLDDPAAAGRPVRTDTTSPFDYAPGSTAHASGPLDTAALPDGEHTITAQVTTAAGVVTQHATFTTDNDVAALLTTSRSEVTLTSVDGGPATGTSVDVDTSDSTLRPFAATASVDWLTVAPSSGTTPATVSLTAATGLPVGTHAAEVILESPDLPSAVVTVTLTVSAAPLEDFTVVHGRDAKRSGPTPLDGAEVSGDVYPLLAPESDVASTSWWLDDPLMGGTPVRTDAAAPFDFGPGSVKHRAEPLDTTTLADGEHTITVRVRTTDGTQHVSTATFLTSTWHSAPALTTARDNPGSAVVDGVLHVFGGRTRLANGQTPTGTLGSMEALHPAAGGSWTARASMPTPRRTMATGVVDGRIVAVGGEARPDGLPFDATELYDPATDEWTTARRAPTARHGAAAGVIDGRLHVVAGGQFAGAAASAVHEVLTLPSP